MRRKMSLPQINHNVEYDSKAARLRKRYQGLSRVAASINDLYIYGVYPSNYPNLSTVLEQAKDHLKQVIKETKFELAQLEDPSTKYDMLENENIENVEKVNLDD